MEYKTDKRTKNLTLRDIHVGDWVQAWRPLPKEYTPPMKVSSIHYDGTAYLVSDDEGHCNPFEANIKDIDALPIDADLLRGFGFDIVPKKYIDSEYNVMYYGKKIGELLECKSVNLIYANWFYHKYFNEFMQGIHSIFPEIDKLEWKGIKK